MNAFSGSTSAGYILMTWTLEPFTSARIVGGAKLISPTLMPQIGETRRPVSLSAAFDGLGSSMNAAIAFVSFIRHLGPSLPLAAGRWVPRCARKDISRHFRC